MMLENPDADYAIRWYTDDDRDAFVDLYNSVFGGGSHEWFQWKYLDNPRRDEVPILVADADGDLAGARPQVPFLMRVGDETALAYRFGDTMVHQDHRRKGVFSTLTRHALDHYRQTSARFMFNCPNDLSRPGFLDAGGRTVANLTSYYRVQNPTALSNDIDAASVRVASRMATPAMRAILAARDHRRTVPADVTVTRHDRIPVETLVDLDGRGGPDGVTAVRDRAFLEWRYENPRWDYRAYTATVDGEPIAAVVTGTQVDDAGVTITNVVDVLPGTSVPGRDDALLGVLDTVIEDYAASDLLAYVGDSIPGHLLRRLGFRPDDVPPLSAVTSPTTLVAYDLSDEGTPPWRVGGRDLRRPETWSLQYAELDAR